MVTARVIGARRAAAAAGICASLAIGLAPGCGPHGGPGSGGNGGAGGACLAGAARCTAALQCCSNRCNFRGGTSADGTCSASAELDGPFAALPAPRKRADLRLDPPSVIEATAVAGGDGQSVVNVRFADDARLGRTVALTTDDGPIVLRDDGTAGDARAGDHVFSAAIPVAFSAIQAQQRAALDDLKRRGITSIPVFDGPQLIARRAIDFTIDPSVIHFLDPVPAFDVHRTLMVTDLGVVEDPGRTFNPCTSAGTAMGTWTFGYLMTQIANQVATGVDPADLVHDWLTLWDTDQIVNGFDASRRTTIDDIIAAWPKVAATGKLDLARAPLRLLAIVNRIDLAGNPSYGHVGGAEGRFVFGVVTPTCAVRPFTVILEYGVPRRTCTSLRDWAQAWVALDAMTPGSAAYNTALEALTEQFAHAGVDPGKPAGSALDQLRTDENALHPSGAEQPQWELREFMLRPTGGGVRLQEVTVKQTPDERFNAERDGTRAADLATWINGNQAQILAGAHTVPDVLPFAPGDSFLAASTLNFFTLINNQHHRDFWTAPGIANNDARARFSLATCNGCHGEETRTGFQHVVPEAFGTAAQLSGFLTGETVPDPVVAATTRTYNDLAARAVKLAQFADSTCAIRKFPGTPARPQFPLPPIALRPDLRAH